jgi:MFS family permease
MTWVIIMCTFSPMISSICAPGSSQTLEEFGTTSRTIGTLMISIYVLGYAVGPLFLAPLSELYGRPIVINWSTAFFNIFLIGCSFAPNMPSLIIMRVLAGIGGSAVMTIVSACIGDVFKVHERAAASAIVIGTPSISPICMFAPRFRKNELIICSGTSPRRLHIAVSWLEVAVLDRNHGNDSDQYSNVHLHEGVEPSYHTGEEDTSPQKRIGTG